MNFTCLHLDSKSFARRGELELLHGRVQTPVFMPVGTYGAVRGISSTELEKTGAEIMLANTYHMFRRPGLPLIEQLGGMHKFCGWDRPLLTDSGGFQIFSLSKNRQIRDEGVSFQDPVDGQRIELTPESVVDTQERWGSDIMMVLDECPASDSPASKILEAVMRTEHWALRSKEAHSKLDLALFPIVQGACDLKLRARSLEGILAIEKGRFPWQGIAVGGLSVGESKVDFVNTVYGLRNSLPTDRPRYLMGVGTPRDLVFAVACGFDMFDCVMPTRNARHGIVMTRGGRLNLFNQVFRDDDRPLDSECDCQTCSRYSRAFLRHLFMMQDALSQHLASVHNVHYFVSLLGEVRRQIESNEFAAWAKNFLERPENIYLGSERGFSEFPSLSP